MPKKNPVPPQLRKSAEKKPVEKAAAKAKTDANPKRKAAAKQATKPKAPVKKPGVNDLAAGPAKGLNREQMHAATDQAMRDSIVNAFGEKVAE